MRDRELLELSAIVTGDVQGVGFRATTKVFADNLGLTGMVRNVSDGSVEICAQGERVQLENLLAQLRQRYSSNTIRHIDFKFLPVREIYRDFRIVR